MKKQFDGSQVQVVIRRRRRKVENLAAGITLAALAVSRFPSMMLGSLILDEAADLIAERILTHDSRY